MFINKMEGQNYIDKTREYLDYLETHLNNVAKAFLEVSEACRGMWWVSDDYQWHTFRREVEMHDLSKFSAEEFTQYRKNFYPVKDEKKMDSDDAWEHHKTHNQHHHETANNSMDIVHMVIDWTAMGYVFGDTAQEYYEANKSKISLSPDHEKLICEIFDRIDKE